MIFQGDKTTIIKLLQGKHVPFLAIVHSVIHGWTKLVVQILNSLCFTTKIEALLAFVTIIMFIPLSKHWSNQN
jgi:hypothetical protein